ncbi:VOC family protein [Chelatococcus reniformis]|uniref:Riboflavin deaminase n=1 Tax=Chelatococcus reniformis TaxID=1494448 RepID=A0A916UJ38_9HYPH|nr:VOC family protein [Chelatococcus reniformis]GGC73655.1 riboflavin deaminase [Chelatococcus reniformis]
MLTLDHLTVVAPTLEAGVEHVRDQLGVEMVPGGTHREMGTYNCLLRIGDNTFLEVIAVDPEAPRAPTCWFGLGDSHAVARDWTAGRRLRAWVARADDLVRVLATHGALLGQRTRVSRGGRSWWFAVRPDGSLPADGAVPAAIDWGARRTPAPMMPESGVTLSSFTVEHPAPPALAALYDGLAIAGRPEIRPGPQCRLRATFRTPSGLRELS